MKSDYFYAFDSSSSHICHNQMLSGSWHKSWEIEFHFKVISRANIEIFCRWKVESVEINNVAGSV